MQSSAAKVEHDEATASQIVEAMRFLARQGARGMAWLGPDLRVVARFGWFTDGLTIGIPVTETLDALIGLDDDLLAMKSDSGPKPLILANVLPANASGVRITLAVYWIETEQQFLLAISRAATFADIELRLAAETRARTIAEAQLAAQARVVQRMNQELAEANRDLKEFASVISHDLRAPLRGLRYAATDAKTALASDDASVATAQIDRVIGLSQRMGTMLTGLLDYARIGRKSEAVEQVRTEALVSEIAESISAGATQAISIEGDWPTIATLSEPLDIILRNLIENAVKHHDQAEGRIIVHGEQDGNRLLISVRDDGPGIDPVWHEAIFLPFRQIADSEDADGAGIGLALVKKTAERFGGSVTVQSDPSRGRGTTFTVAWPLTLPA